jgi:type I restriction enzyme S subunit
MKANWRQCTLGDLLEVKHGFAFLGEHFGMAGSHVVLTPGNFHEEGGFREQVEKRKWYSGEIPDEYILHEGDLIVAMTEQAEGLLGSSAIIPKSDFYLHNQRLGLIKQRDQNQSDIKFLYYLFNSKPVRQQIRGSASGTKIRHTSPTRIGEVRVTIPAVDEQRRIAGILSAYDDLIENNLRRIQILEEMARALYREWFVEFRFPGNEKLRRIDSPLGAIPAGWECFSLAQFINVTHGYAFKGDHFSDDPTSRVLMTPGNFKVGGGIKYDKLKFYSEDGPLESDYVFEPMDLIVTMTDLSKAGDTLGFPAFVPELHGLSFLHNQRVGKVVPRGEFFPKHFFYCLFCHDRYRHHIVGGATGMSVKHTSPGRILEFTSVIPKESTLIDAFEDFAGSVFSQINVLIRTTENLRRTRDLLLPRMLSGQINLTTI